MKRRTNLVSIITPSVKMERANGALLGLCPFHDEDSASFYVFPDHYHCFGCGAHGDCFDWIQRTRNVTKIEALNMLAGDSLGDFILPPPMKLKIKPKPISEAALQQYERLKQETSPVAFLTASRALNVTEESLRSLGAAWSVKQRAWMFPMFNCDRVIIGFRFRAPNAAKWSMKNAHSGLFIPNSFTSEGSVIFVEGPTDTAALLSIGIDNVIGRPSALGGMSLVCEFVKRFDVTRAIIIADNDPNNVGFQGAQKLAELIGITSKVYRTKAKDIRASLKAGLTREQFLASVI